MKKYTLFVLLFFSVFCHATDFVVFVEKTKFDPCCDTIGTITKFNSVAPIVYGAGVVGELLRSDNHKHLVSVGDYSAWIDETKLVKKEAFKPIDSWAGPSGFELECIDDSYEFQFNSNGTFQYQHVNLGQKVYPPKKGKIRKYKNIIFAEEGSGELANDRVFVQYQNGSLCSGDDVFHGVCSEANKL